MLSYFRYFSVVAFIAVMVAAFFAGLYFRQFAVDRILRAPTENIDGKVGEYFAHTLWCRYAESFAPLAKQPAKAWQASPLFPRLEANSLLLLRVVPAAKISLYLPDQTLLTSTDDREVTFFSSEGEDRSGFTAALKGETHSRMITSMGLYDKDKPVQRGAFVHTLVPIRANFCGKNDPSVPMVMEVYRDVSISWDYLYYFQAAVTGGIIATFIILYFALFLTSRKTEKIIEKQHEENLALAEAKARAELQSSEKSMFLANVTHELRTPLNAVIGFSEILKSESLGPIGNPQYQEYINDIYTSGTHLLSLINDILDYSKAEAQKLEVESVEVNLTKLGQTCIRLVEPRAKSAKVVLVADIPEKHILLTADPKRIKQVMLNLLSNSVKFTPENGRVTLSLREDLIDGLVQIIIKDTGIGIAPKDISRALAPFGQIDSSLSRRFEGTGLGLPLTKKLTEIMGGEFDIQSEVGLGTAVTLTFPLRREEKATGTGQF